jgi:Flp pilus assembly pilin Flp
VPKAQRNILYSHIYIAMNVSEKTREYLNKKLLDCQGKLTKLKRKRRIIKTCYVITVLLSIGLSSAVSVMATLTLPLITVTILSTFSAILTGISARFNFYNKKAEIKGLIDKLNKIKAKIEFVLSCNGDISQADYEKILTEF